MAYIKAPSTAKHWAYERSKYRCTNKNCGKQGWFTDHKKGRTCPKCYAAVEVIDTKRVVPRTLRCTYCNRSDCPCLEDRK